jgi:hypothetical protein
LILDIQRVVVFQIVAMWFWIGAATPLIVIAIFAIFARWPNTPAPHNANEDEAWWSIK